MIDASLWNEIGNIYLKLGSHRDAIHAIRKAIDLDPYSGWFHYNLGESYLQAGLLAESIRQFRKSLQLLDTPQDQAVVWNKIGDACRALKDMPSAIRAYKKADLLDDQAPHPTMDADELFSDPGDFLDTIREKIDVDTSIVLSGVKRLVERAEPNAAKRVEETPQAARQEQKPQVPLVANQDDTQPSRSVRSERADVPEPNRQVPSAQPATAGQSKARIEQPLAGEKTIYVIPDPSELLPRNQPAPAALKPPATASAVKAVSEQSSPAFTSLELEGILAKVRVYENITRVNPSNDRAWDTLGKLYKSLGKFEDAIAAYRRAISIAPDKEVYSYFIGLLFSVVGRHEEAVQAFQMVLEKNPEYILAHGALAGVYHRMGQETRANHHIAVALPKMKSESAYNRACFHAICGDNEVALEFLRIALRNKDTTVEWIKSDPDLDPIRSDERYQDLISGKEIPGPETDGENYISYELDGSANQLMPVLNQSVAR